MRYATASEKTASKTAEKIAAERELLRARALATLRAGNGVYNVNPWSFLLGTLGAIAAVVFAVYCLSRERTKVTTESAPPSPATGPAPTQPADEIWVEVE